MTITVPEPPTPSPSPSSSPAHRRPDDAPTLRHGRDPRHRQRRPQADHRLRPRPGHRPPASSARAARSSSARTPGAPCDMFVAAISAGATSMGVDVHQVGVVPTPALAFLAGQGDFAAGIMVSASHNPADDNGLKVLDKRGLKLDDDIEDELEAAHLAVRGARPASATPSSAGSTTASGLLERYRASRLALARTISDGRPDRPRLRQRVGRRRRSGDPRRDRRERRGHPQRPGRGEHQRQGRSHGAGRARGRSRRPRAPTSASPWTAMRTGSSRSTRAGTSSTGTRCSASSPSTGSRGAS